MSPKDHLKLANNTLPKISVERRPFSSVNDGSFRRSRLINSIVTTHPDKVELEPAPFREDWILEGHPQARSRQIARSRDRTMSIIVWSCTRGRFRWVYFADEIAHVISGEVFITDHTGTERRLGSGDTAFFPAGSCSVWRVPEEVRKVAVCRAALPKVAGLVVRIWNRISRRIRLSQWPAILVWAILSDLPRMPAPASAIIGL